MAIQQTRSSTDRCCSARFQGGHGDYRRAPLLLSAFCEAGNGAPARWRGAVLFLLLVVRSPLPAPGDGMATGFTNRPGADGDDEGGAEAAKELGQSFGEQADHEDAPSVCELPH